MEVIQRIAQLARPFEQSLLGQKKALAARGVHDLFEIMARHIVHHQKVAPFFGKEIRHLGQVRMVKAGQHACLSMELLMRLALKFLVGIGIRLDFLDRAEAAVQAKVFGLIDAAHSPAANNVAHPIPFT